MTESMKKFLEMLSADKQLLDSVFKMDKNDLITLAKKKGMTLSDADFQPDSELDDSELETVAGGKGCGCALGGGGVQGGKDDVCGCVGFGIGYDTTYEKTIRCMCNVAGMGLSANDDDE